MALDNALTGGHDYSFTGMTWRNSAVAALVAGVPFIVALLVVSSRHGTGSAFLVACLLAVPFLVIGARVEGDGDLSSLRRRSVLGAFGVAFVIELASYDSWIFAGWILMPLIGIMAWFAAGASKLSASSLSTNRHFRGHSRAPKNGTD